MPTLTTVPRQRSAEATRMEDEPEETNEVGLWRAFENQASAHGTVTAVESDGYALSYTELLSKSLYTADRIYELDPWNRTPIGILIPRGVSHILAQLAIVKAGRACVPLDTRMADDYLESVLANLHSSFILTDQENAHRLVGFTRLTVEHTVNKENYLPGLCLSPQPNGARSSRCSHIFHTSGTSGKPKAVKLFASGLINLCRDPGANWSKRGHRVGHAASVVFDISLVEIWGSLLNGATIVVLPMETVLDPLELSNFIRHQRLDVLQLTTSLLNVTAHACPSAFTTLDTLITGGEAINCQSIRSIFDSGPPRRIINGYGPTECSVYCLWHCVTPREAQHACIPVGKPFCNVEAFLVDESLVPVKAGEVGELLVAGAGVAGGYIGDEERTADRFISFPRRSSDGFARMEKTRVYRTGDLMRRDENGVHYYIGRRDNQVKIAGHRVELESIESILQEVQGIHAATVVKITPPELGRAPLLVAFCVPTCPDITPVAIAKDYVRRYPHSLMPRFEVTDRLPLRTTGKVDRAQLERQYTRAIEDTPARPKPGPWQESSLEAELRYLWLDVLGLPNKDLEPTDDFMTMGGNSLMVATLIARINHAFGISLRASALYENMTLEGLTHILTRIHRDGQATVPVHTNEEQLWLQDSQLGRRLHRLPESPVVDDWEAASEGRVFLTGATGFVGAFFLAQLLQTPTVRKVCCLVRAHDKAHGRARVQQTLLRYQLHPSHIDKLIILAGSFGKPHLGLSIEQYDYYADWASVVFHLGAKVNYLATYSAHRDDNVLATVHILQFATHKRTKPTHYTSTIAAYGPTGLVLGTKFLPEDERPAPHIPAVHYDTGYAQSQLVAETIVWNAIDNGLPIAIYRPGFVLGHSKTGVCNPDDFISRLFASCMAMGSYPRLPNQRKEFVPVDFVVNALLHISRSRESLGHAFNLVHPHKGSAIDICTGFDLLNRVSPYSMRGTAYPEWVQSLSMRPEDPLYPLVPMLREKVLDDRTRWEVYEDMAEYGRSSLHSALSAAPDILDCSSMDQLFERCLKSWLGVLDAGRGIDLRIIEGDM
ncbi:NRPS-like enzyme [Aspergillus ustus]|uniref:NRPS-like enzyme n=1 Tax=Aspergillus ustus TaxID=40382 RepID=A0A0C1BW02_ASPUT|nr:NRPS-like enzyme [Aspergillus ustus]